MIKQLVLNGETLINVPADMTVLLDLGLTQSEAQAAINDCGTEKELKALRSAREPLLIDADRLVNLALDNNQDIAPFRQYRQALRDITDNFKTLSSVVWPTKPQLSQS